MGIEYWDKEVETLGREELSKLQLARLREMVGYALKTPFYGRKLAKAGIDSGDDIHSLDDLKRIPLTTKDDLRRNFPKGFLAVDMSEVVRIHSSSGTTGVPTVIYFNAGDIDRWTDMVARSIVATGAGRVDVFQNMMTYGLFTGGLGLHYGAERVGMAVIPVSSGNTQRQIQIMRDYGTTVVHATPSYLLHVNSVISSSGEKVNGLKLRKAFIGAEPHSEDVRKKIESLFGIDAYNSYGLSEMNGPGLAFECVHKNGMHVWEDGYIVEVIDRDSGECVKDGEVGEVVVTNLIRRAMPLLRYRTRDLACILEGACPCGRTGRRLSRIMGRTDDMLIINGVNVFPSQIEEVVMKEPQVGTNYLIRVEKQGELDKLTVEVEIYSKMFAGEVNQLEQLRGNIRERLQASITIRPAVKLHEPGFLPVSEGKAKRVLDLREGGQG